MTGAGGPCALRLKVSGLVVASASTLLGGLVLLSDAGRPEPRILTVVERLAPLHVLGWVWLAAAALGFVAVAVHRLRAPAFGLGVALHCMWGCSALAGWLFLEDRDGWVAASVYLVIAALIVVVSGIREGTEWDRH